MTSLKQRGYLVVLFLSSSVITIDWATKALENRVTLIESWLFPLAYLLIGGMIFFIWRKKYLNLIEAAIFITASLNALIKLSDILFFEQFVYQGQELINLLFWFPMIYVLAFIMFDRIQTSLLASISFLVMSSTLFLYRLFGPAVGFANFDIMLFVRFFAVGVAYIVLLIWVVRLKEAYQDSISQMKVMSHLANRDPLTNIHNRRAFMESIEYEVGMSRKQGSLFSIVLFDLDNFKAVNDTFGHNVGDLVLKQLVDFVREYLRPNDRLYRFGGDEFIIVLPNTDVEKAVLVADRLREIVKKQIFNDSSSITLSLGVVRYQNDKTIDDFIARADKALYLAKTRGRNRVEYLI